MPKKVPPFIRLYENYKEDANGCWNWTGQTGSSGYGQIKAFGLMASCHRVSYELYFGKIPEGKEVMHQCDNRICINPDHLSVGSHSENMKEAKDRGRMVGAKGQKGVSGADRAQSNQVLVLGKPYGSQKMAEKELGLGSGTVRYWIKTNNTKAKVISKEEFMELENA